MSTGPEAQLVRTLEEALRDLRTHEPDSEEYATILDRVVKLHKLKEESKPSRVNPDTWVLAGTNLLGIIMILKHEQLNVITSKAMSFIIRPR